MNQKRNLMALSHLLLGLDVGGTKCAAVIGTADGHVLDRREWASDAQRGAPAMIDDLLRNGRELMSAHHGVRAAGVPIGGPLDAARGVIHSPPNLPGWDHIPLREILERELSLPVRVEHDAAACALAERLWGAARGFDHVAYLTCGTGFGVGLILGGRVHYGARGHNCEIGHARYRDDGPEAFGKRGSLEAYCAGSSLTRLAAWKFPSRWTKQPPTPPQIGELASQGDADAQEIIAINARAVGETCALLADLFFPEIIVLGSLASHLGEPWLAQVRAAFSAEALPTAFKACQLVPAGLGRRLQDCSALAAAMNVTSTSRPSGN
jgi:glucokinase